MSVDARIDRPARRSWARKLATAITLLALPLAGVVVSAGTASADANSLTAAVNAERAAKGLPPLTMASDLNAVAQAWAQQMASTGKFEHNPNLSRQVTAWRAIGENIAYAGSESAAHTNLMNSPGHRANILSTTYNQIGIGLAWRGSTLYVVEDFRQSSNSTVGWQKTNYNPTIYAVTTGGRHAATYQEWAGAGFPAPRSTETEYVHYAWSGSIYAVTFWKDGWQWDHLNYTQWSTAGKPSPRVAGWIDGSTVWKKQGGSTVYLTDREGSTHSLSYKEWADTGYKSPEIRSGS